MVVINDYNAEPQLNETLVKRIVAVGGQTVPFFLLPWQVTPYYTIILGYSIAQIR